MMAPVDADADLVPLAQGREAEIFLRPDGSVLKLMRPGWNHRVETEVAVLRALRDTPMAAPDVLGTTTVDGRAGLILERIPGIDQLTFLSKRPLSFPRAAGVMADLHVRMHDCVAPDSLLSLHADLRARIERAADLPAHLARRALELLAGLPDGDRLCHGDLHPGNIIGSFEFPAVIDWGDASRGDPVADVARTHLLVRLGKPPPGSSRLVRVVVPVGGRLMAWRYLAEYQRRRPVDPVALRRWEIVRAAARFAEHVEEENDALQRFIERSLD